MFKAPKPRNYRAVLSLIPAAHTAASSTRRTPDRIPIWYLSPKNASPAPSAFQLDAHRKEIISPICVVISRLGKTGRPDVKLGCAPDLSPEISFFAYRFPLLAARHADMAATGNTEFVAGRAGRAGHAGPDRSSAVFPCTASLGRTQQLSPSRRS